MFGSNALHGIINVYRASNAEPGASGSRLKGVQVSASGAFDSMALSPKPPATAEQTMQTAKSDATTNHEWRDWR